MSIGAMQLLTGESYQCSLQGEYRAGERVRPHAHPMKRHQLQPQGTHSSTHYHSTSYAITSVDVQPSQLAQWVQVRRQPPAVV